MANDFSGDSNCVALYRFESGALTTDSKGSNTLTNVNTVAEATGAGEYKEGSCAADFELSNSEYFYCDDGDLAAGFPLKDGDTGKTISVCFWLRPESYPNPVSGNARLVTKIGVGTFSLLIGFYGDAGTMKLRFAIGYSGGSSLENVYLAPTNAFTTGQWYHFGVTYQDSDKSYRLRIYDETNDTANETTGNTTNNINVETAPFEIGNSAAYAGYYDGIMDELVVFKDVLSQTEIDQIRNGTYGAAAGSAVPFKRLGTVPFCTPNRGVF